MCSGSSPCRSAYRPRDSIVTPSSARVARRARSAAAESRPANSPRISRSRTIVSTYTESEMGSASPPAAPQPATATSPIRSPVDRGPCNATKAEEQEDDAYPGRHGERQDRRRPRRGASPPTLFPTSTVRAARAMGSPDERTPPVSEPGGTGRPAGSRPVEATRSGPKVSSGSGRPSGSLLRPRGTRSNGPGSGPGWRRER